MKNIFSECDFKKGKIDFLEGKVLVYSSSDPDSIGPRYPAVYASHKMEDIVSYIEANNFEFLLNSISQSQREGSDNFSCFSISTILKSLDEIPQINGDVLYMGQSKNIFSLSSKIDSFIFSYMDEYIRQLDIEPRAGHLREGKFAKKLWEYVGRIRSASLPDDKEKVKRVYLEFKRFMRDSPFLPNLDYLVDYVIKNPNNLGVIEALVSVAGASHDNDVERMIKFKDKLERLV